MSSQLITLWSFLLSVAWSVNGFFSLMLYFIQVNIFIHFKMTLMAKISCYPHCQQSFSSTPMASFLLDKYLIFWLCQFCSTYLSVTPEPLDCALYPLSRIQDAIQAPFCLLQLGTNTKVMLDNWNIGTTRWLRECVYDRVPRRFAVVAVFFVSAFWHGFYPVYYFCFLSAALLTMTGRCVLVRNALRFLEPLSPVLLNTRPYPSIVVTELAVFPPFKHPNAQWLPGEAPGCGPGKNRVRVDGVRPPDSQLEFLRLAQRWRCG